MTVTQAAEFLDVSRAFVIRAVKQGKLSCRLVGKRRFIPSAALQRLKDRMFQEARTAVDDLASISQTLGLYDLDGPAPKTP
jgi:excisionase family DNA binding protein